MQKKITLKKYRVIVLSLSRRSDIIEIADDGEYCTR